MFAYRFLALHTAIQAFVAVGLALADIPCELRLSHAYLVALSAVFTAIQGHLINGFSKRMAEGQHKLLQLQIEMLELEREALRRLRDEE